MVRLSWLPRSAASSTTTFAASVQIPRIVVDRLGGEAGADMFVNAVGSQQKDIAFFNLKRLIVDFNLRIDPQRPAQITLLG